MKYTNLPHTKLEVSQICLGTMTFGKQNTQAEGHAQLDFALEHGINFIDTAEMYPVPAVEATYGHTETIIGNWLAQSKKRDQIVLATKIAGPNRGLGFIREDMRFTPQSIRLSVEKSLKRLQTEYIDLYQLHWPERKVNFFGQRGFKPEPDDWQDNFAQTLETFDALIKEGKICHLGVSNESPWGVMRFLEESKRLGLPRIATIQNPYSLVNRTFEATLAEVSLREKVGLLAYSPLGFGLLSGKYDAGDENPAFRLNQFKNFKRYNAPSAREASRLYSQLARDNGLSPAQLALAFVQQQPFVASTIVGATSLKQLEENIASQHVILSETLFRDIDHVQSLIPDPAP